MTVYVFGNPDVEKDSLAVKAAKNLEGKIAGVDFIFVTPSIDLQFVGGNTTILDVVDGISKVTLLENPDLTKLVLPSRITAHDFDLSMQLQYLQKLGKLGPIKIIGLPMESEINYDLLQSILRKLVAQDIHGS